MAWGELAAAIVSAAIVVALSGVAEAAGTNMQGTIKDLYEAPPEGQKGRLFVNFNQAVAYNTSIAFTMPLFTYALPGVEEFTAAGYTASSFGALAWTGLFLLTSMGIAIYTTSQDTYNRAFTDSHESFLTRVILDSVSGLPNVVDTTTCSSLAICSAYGDVDKYGYLSWAVRFLAPFPPDDVPEEELTEFEKAARYGAWGEDCQYEFPCFVQPLDLLLYMYDYWQDDL